MQAPFFSILIPVYNKEDYLEDCINSIINQEFDDYEIILVDDGSTDRSDSICDIFANSYSNITVFHGTNKGQSVARNMALNYAKGKYVIFVDADDLLTDRALFILNNQIINNGSPDVVISRRITLAGEKRYPCAYSFDIESYLKMDKVEIFKNMERQKDLWLGVWIFTCSHKYLTENKLFFYERIQHEDEEWCPRVFFYATSIVFNNEPVYINRVDIPNSTISTPNIKKLFDLMKVEEALKKEFENGRWALDIQHLMYVRRCRIIFYAIIQSTKYQNNDRYSEWLNVLNLRIDMLRQSDILLHRCMYYLCRLFGTKLMIYLLSLIMRIRGK
nr:glycosyltransferase family 2 protein [uncultured Butyrivibrio sp.]